MAHLNPRNLFRGFFIAPKNKTEGVGIEPTGDSITASPRF